MSSKAIRKEVEKTGHSNTILNLALMVITSKIVWECVRKLSQLSRQTENYTLLGVPRSCRNSFKLVSEEGNFYLIHKIITFRGNMKKCFFGNCFSADSWQKLKKKRKIHGKFFKKFCCSGSTLNCTSPVLTMKVDTIFLLLKRPTTLAKVILRGPQSSCVSSGWKGTLNESEHIKKSKNFSSQSGFEATKVFIEKLE